MPKLPRTIGRYEVVDRLGYGGMGVVYRCRDPRIGRTVAVKLLRATDEGLRDRFLQEAQSAGHLKHRNIVTIYDFGDQDGQPYIVMEFVEGFTLAEQIREWRPLTLARKLDLVEELALGLDYAHQKGVVHRDVKPANIMIDLDGVLRILDFGIARVADSSLTQSGTMIGTPHYMSPEQVEGRPVDRRSDIFAVGLVVYELLSYRQAFPGEMIHNVMRAILHDEPTPLHELLPDLDPALERIVDTAIAKDPARRYQTLAAMVVDVAHTRQRLASRHGIASGSTIRLLTPPPAAPSGRTPRFGTDREALEKRRGERVAGYLESARRAFDQADYASAVDACEQAVLLDADEPQVLDLLEKARAALDAQQVRAWLQEARDCLDQQDAGAASELVTRALGVDPASKGAQQLQAAIDEFERNREREAERQRAAASAVARARAGLAAGEFETALRAAGEVLVHDPGNPEAHELMRQALTAMEERRRREEREQVVAALIEEQKRIFASGRWRDAIAALEQATPPHPAVAKALAALRTELVTLERRDREEKERLRREQAEAEQRRLAQQRWVTRQMDLARSAIEARQFVDAIEVLLHVERVSPDASNVAALLEQARAGQAAADAEEERQRRIAEDLRRAREELAAGQVAEAQSLVEAVLGLAPDHADARACRDEIEVALQVSRQKAATERAARLAVEAARRQFDAGEHAAALALLEAINPPHPLVSQAHEELSSTAAAIERQRKEVADRARREAIQAAVDHARKTEDVDGALAALDEALALDPAHPAALAMRERLLANREETRRRAEHDRQAQAAIAEARRLFVAGEISRALDALTQFAPPHPAVNQVLEELNARAAELERQRQLAEARREREAKLREVLTRGSDALAAGDVAAAMRLAGEVLAIDRDDEGARALHARAQLEQRRRDEENERLRAESERAARQRRVDEACAKARDELGGGRFTAALDRLVRIQRTDGPVASVGELIDQARAGLAAAQTRAREEARRQAEADARQEAEAKRLEQQRTKINTLVKEARRQLSRNNPALALQRVDEAIALDAEDAEVLALRAEIETAIETRNRADVDTGSETHEQADVEAALTPPSRRGRSIERTAGAIVAVIVAGAALWFWNRAGHVAVPPATSTVVTTTVAPQTTTTTLPTATVQVPDQVDGIVAAATALIRQGDLTGAMRAVVGGLRGVPNNAALDDLKQQILRNAAAGARQAKQAADRAGGGARPAYEQATRHVRDGGRLRDGGRAEAAVTEFQTATRLFTEAAKPQPPLPPTTAPTITPTTIPAAPRTTSVVTSTTTSQPTTSIPPTTSAVVSTRAADERAITLLLNQFMEQYKTAYEKLDADAIGRLLSLPPARMRELQRDLPQIASYELTYQPGPVRFASDVSASAAVQTTINVVTKAGGRQAPQRVTRELQFAKSAGSWKIVAFK